MSDEETRTAAFGTYGITLKNPNYFISGRSEERRIVAISLWLHELEGADGSRFYERPSWGDWFIKAKRAFFDDLNWSRKELDGIVHLVVAVADEEARSSGLFRTKSNHARPDLVMKIVHMDPEVGSFRLEQI
ncbi:hypothetical protein [Bradyrhizobium sp. OAE829]|uniref:hypothetical protein n=1 Tax=Bradyrhizobium sp. OAE829 TaxID=2663807 RepID=UPI00178B3906